MSTPSSISLRFLVTGQNAALAAPHRAAAHCYIEEHLTDSSLAALPPLMLVSASDSFPVMRFVRHARHCPVWYQP